LVLLLEHMAVKFHYSQAYYGKDCVAIWIWYLLFLLHKSISFFFIFGQLANVTIDSSRVVWTASLISYNVSPLNFILIPSIFAVWSCVSAEEERGGKGETSSQFYMILVYSVMSYDPNLLTQAVSLLHGQALKDLKAKAQKGAIGGSGLKKSGKKWVCYVYLWYLGNDKPPANMCCLWPYVIVTKLVVLC